MTQSKTCKICQNNYTDPAEIKFIAEQPGEICYGCVNNLRQGITPATPAYTPPPANIATILEEPKVTGYETPGSYGVPGNIPLPDQPAVGRLAVTPQPGNEGYNQGIPPSTSIIGKILGAFHLKNNDEPENDEHDQAGEVDPQSQQLQPGENEHLGQTPSPQEGPVVPPGSQVTPAGQPPAGVVFTPFVGVAHNPPDLAIVSNTADHTGLEPNPIPPNTEPSNETLQQTVLDHPADHPVDQYTEHGTDNVAGISINPQA